MDARRRRHLSLAAAGLMALWSCQGSPGRMEPVTTQEIESHIRFLSDDLLEGRAVGSKGIETAARYQEDYFKAWGLEPAFGGSFRQAVPLRSVRTDLQASLEVLGPSEALRPVLFDDFVVNSEREDIPAECSGELVYCGFGIQAPERGWDDIKGLDVRGKVLLVEINEPGNRPGGVFDGEDMTYYGRWPYKFEKAAELGAAGVFIVHDTKGAAYGWEVVRNGWAKESFFLPDKDPSLLFQGWVSGATAEAIFGAARLDRRALRARAETPDFVPVPLGLRVKVRQEPGHRTVDGVNVAGIVRARHKNALNRMVVVSAHYDHLGRDETLAGDQIFNGAVDNCSATASLLALAGYCAQRPERLKADLCFLATTAEEMLMLGSDHFVRHMPFPPETVAANINLEMTNVWGETEDVLAIGARYSDLDAVCREAAGTLGLRYIPERNGELGFFFRSDQISFARAGIPAVWLSQGVVSKGPDKGYVQRRFEEYRTATYHRVNDEMRPDWDYRGTLQIVDWAREIIAVLESREAMPQFLPASSFKRKAAPAADGKAPVEKPTKVP